MQTIFRMSPKFVLTHTVVSWRNIKKFRQVWIQVTLVVYKEIYFEVYIKKEYMCLKNNTAKLYFIYVDFQKIV